MKLYDGSIGKNVRFQENETKNLATVYKVLPRFTVRDLVFQRHFTKKTSEYDVFNIKK